MVIGDVGVITVYYSGVVGRLGFVGRILFIFVFWV